MYHFCPLQYCKLDKRIEMILASSVPQTELVFSVVPARRTQAWQLDLLIALNVPTAGDFLLVFAILTLNLTVTQGLINGLIFYANIVWAYKMVFFPAGIQENHGGFLFLQGFVSWLNLDFGIEACFFVGLDAYWKT